MQEFGDRLSESPLWQWQRDYFAREGVKAWSENVVPDFVTNNCFTAAAFVRVVRAYLDDYVAACGDEQPERVYVLEAGAGSGRFGYRFVQMLHAAGGLPCPVTYVLTDFTESILGFWREHPRLQSLLNSGKLDLALYDSASEAPIRLERSGKVLKPGSLGSPVVVIGNYYFDSLPHDLYRTVNGELQEGRMWVDTPADVTAVDLESVSKKVEYVPLEGLAYEREDWNAVLNNYRHSLPNGNFTFPVGGMKSLEFLASLSARGCFMLTADKGPNLLSSLVTGDHGRLDIHGAISASVNFHALAQWLDSRGEVFEQMFPYHRLNVLVLQMGNHLPDSLNAVTAFEREIIVFGPDDYANFKDIVFQNQEVKSPTDMFTFLRLSNWDPEIIMGLMKRLYFSIPSCSEAVRQAFSAGFRKSWSLHFPLDKKIRYASLLGSMCAGMTCYADAFYFFEQSLALEHEDPNVVFNGALCLARLDRQEECRAWLERAEAMGVPKEECDTVRIELD